MSTDWTPDFGTLDAPAPAWPSRRPLRIALLGDFGGGAAAGRLDRGDALAARKPVPVEADTLDAVMRRLARPIAVPVGEGGHAVEVPLPDLDALHPDALVPAVPALQTLLQLKKRLASPATFAKAAAEVQRWTGGARRKPSRVQRGRRARGAAPAPGATLTDFARLTGRPSAAERAAAQVDALLKDVVSPFVVPAAHPEQRTLQASVDAALSDALRALLHAPDLQAAEALWRGLDFLLRRLETGADLQVHLYDISAEELAADLSGSHDLAESALHRLLVTQPATQKDGGYAFVGALYRFEATPPHAELLGRAARIAAAAGARFVTEVATDAFADPRRAPHPLVRQAFAALRALPEAAQLLMAGPRFLLRHPYGRRSDPISAFGFEEFTAADGLRGMLWGHPALAVLAALAGPQGAPVLDDLPVHHFFDADGDCTALPCTDRLLGHETAAQLVRQGFVALVAARGETRLRLAGLEPAARPAARPDARMGARVQLQAALKPAAAPAPAKAALAAAASDGDDLSLPGPADGGDDALGDLLAGLDDTPAPDDPLADTPAGGDDIGAMDAELSALLASLDD